MSEISTWSHPGKVTPWMAFAVGKFPQPLTRYDWYRLYLKAAFIANSDKATWETHAREIFDIPELSLQGKRTRAERILKNSAVAEGAAYGYAFRAAELIYDKNQ